MRTAIIILFMLLAGMWWLLIITAKLELFLYATTAAIFIFILIAYKLKQFNKPKKRTRKYKSEYHL